MTCMEKDYKKEWIYAMTGRLLELLTSVCSLVFLASRAFVGLYFRSCLRRHSSFLLWKPEHLNRGLCRVAWVALQIERLCLPKFCKWSPNLQCDGTWTWGFGWLGYEGGACMKGISALIKAISEELPWQSSVLQCEDTEKRWPSVNQNRLLPDTESVGAFIWTS